MKNSPKLLSFTKKEQVEHVLKIEGKGTPSETSITDAFLAEFILVPVPEPVMVYVHPTHLATQLIFLGYNFRRAYQKRKRLFGDTVKGFISKYPRSAYRLVLRNESGLV